MARRTLAHRLNAEKDAGPKTGDGQAVTRANALRYDLEMRQLLPGQDREAVAERSAQWNSSLRPNNPWELWLVERIAVESLRVDRCAREESSLRDRVALRAETCWDDDRRAEAEALARGLARDPASVRARLEATRHGCEWLLDRLGELLALLICGGAWDEHQAGRVRDLLGLADDGPASVEAARAEYDRLKSKRDWVLVPLDEADRALAESGMGPDADGAIRRVRRYETSCLRRLEWAWSQLKKGRREVSDPDPATRTPPEPRIEVDDDCDAYNEGSCPTPSASANHRGSIGTPAPYRVTPIAATPAVHAAGTAPPRSSFNLASALREPARGPQPGGNRRSRRAARRAE